MDSRRRRMERGAELVESIYAELGGGWSFGRALNPDLYERAKQLKEAQMAREDQS